MFKAIKFKSFCLKSSMSDLSYGKKPAYRKLGMTTRKELPDSLLILLFLIHQKGTGYHNF